MAQKVFTRYTERIRVRIYYTRADISKDLIND